MYGGRRYPPYILLNTEQLEGVDMKRFDDTDDLDFEEEELIYPINVHESLKAAGGLKQSEKQSIVLSMWIFANFIIAWFMASWLREIFPRYYLLVTILVLVTLQLTVGVYLLGLFLDEKGMVSEMNNSDLLFTNYLNIYREMRAGEESPYPFDVIEMGDGSHMVAIQCLLGYNTQSKSEGTYAANMTVDQMICKAGLPYRKIYSNEKFRGSVAAQQLLSTLSGVDDPELFKAYRAIITGLMDKAENESNVMCVTYLIHAQTRIHKDDLKTVVDHILMTLRRPGNVYREVNVLTYEEIVDFLRRYYGLQVMDMGLVRQAQAVKKKVNCSVTLLKIKGESGKIYDTQEFAKLESELLSDFGLRG